MEQFLIDLMHSVFVDSLSEIISMGIVGLICALFRKKSNK